MIPPDNYEDALTQAEAACAAHICSVLDLRIGNSFTIGMIDGQANGAVFDIGGLLIGDTVLFDSPVHTFRASLELYNRDRAELQRWIMKILHSFPVNRDYRPGDSLREDTNVCQLRLVPDSSAIGKITPTTVSPKNGGADVPTWASKLTFDVVFIARDDVEVDDTETVPMDRPTPGGNTDAPDTPTPPGHDGTGGIEGGTTGGDGPIPED